MSRILVLSASAGSGHTRAALAVEEACRVALPDAEVRHDDILELTSRAYRKAYVGSFLRMVNHVPQLWGALYEASDAVKERRFRDRFVKLYDTLEFHDFREALRSFAPDLVLSTHFLPCQVLAAGRAKGRDRFPLGVVLTDFDVHGYWVQKTADRFYVASEEVAAVLAGRGIPADRIAVTGIPIAAAFADAPSREAARARLGLDGAVPVVLVMAGGAGVGSMEETVLAALSGPPVQVLAVAGRNTVLRAELEGLPVPPSSRLVPLGFVDNVPELMSAADLAVTKSGGLTTSECLAMGLPMLVRDPIPGQEERNADHVVEAGAGVRAYGPHALRFKLQKLLGDPPRLARMAEAARRAGRPRAAQAVVADAIRTFLRR